MKRANGEGHIKKLENGKGYSLRRYVGVKPDGKPKIITVNAQTVSECKRKMEKRVAEWDATKVSPESVSTGTVTMLCKAHFDAHMSQTGRLKPKAADRRESTINNQIAPYSLGDMQVQAVKPQDIRNHIEHLIQNTPLSVSSIEKTLNVINAAYKWAIVEEYLTKNPCTPVLDDLKNRLLKMEEKRACEADVFVMSDEEVIAFERAARTLNDNNGMYKYRSGLGALLLLHTGMRGGELCALRWSDFVGERSLIIDSTRFVAKNRTGEGILYTPDEGVVKNAHARTIELNDDALSVLKEMYELADSPSGDEYILLNDVNKPTNPSNLGNCVNRIYRVAGFGSSISGLHVLRRTCATRMYNAGIDIKAIAAYLGDTEATVSQYYIAVRKKVWIGNEILNVIPYPKRKGIAAPDMRD